MIDEILLHDFTKKFGNLKNVVEESHGRLINDPPDVLFVMNQNVFVKAYLVAACSMLEAFIQELLQAYVVRLQDRINIAHLPFNLVAWIADHERAGMKFQQFLSQKTIKEISDLISPNFWKTMKAFERVGVDLTSSDVHLYKDQIVTTIEKRNRIVHTDDSALDLSLKDISMTISLFIDYSKCLFEAVSNDRYLQPKIST